MLCYSLSDMQQRQYVLPEPYRPGDILVPVNYFGGLLLIVRASKTRDMQYDIIGQGLLIKGYEFGSTKRIPWPRDQCDCLSESFAGQPVFVADVHIALTIEEVIVLGAQGKRNSDMDEESYIATALDRMATNPTTRPRSAVSLTNFSCGSDWR